MPVEELDQLRSIEELQAYQKEVQSRSVEINEQFAGLPFPDEIREEWGELKDQDEEIDKRVAELTARDEYVKSRAKEGPETAERAEFSFPRAAKPKDRDIYDLSTIRMDPGNPERARQDYSERAQRAIELATFPHPDVNREDAQARLSKLVEADSEDSEVARRILTTGSPTYKRAFAKRMVDQYLSREEERALTLGTPKAGAGLAVPFQLDPTVIPISNHVVNPMRAISRIVSLSGTDEWRGITATAVTAQYRAEGAATEDNSPTIAQPTVRVQRADSFVPFSRELSQDWGGLLGELATLFQEGKDVLESVQFWSGAGTTVFPQGIFTALTTSERVAAATNGAFVVGDLYSLASALPPRHRPNAVFMANLTNLNRVRAFDTTGNLYVTLDAARPGTLLGRPVYENSAMGTALTANVAYAVYGDFSRYLIADRVGMDVEVIPNMFDATTGFPTGMRGALAFWRNSAVCLDKNAFRYVASTA